MGAHLYKRAGLHRRGFGGFRLCGGGHSLRCTRLRNGFLRGHISRHNKDKAFIRRQGRRAFTGQRGNLLIGQRSFGQRVHGGIGCDELIAFVKQPDLGKPFFGRKAMDQQHRRFLRHAIGGFGEVLCGVQWDGCNQHIGVTALGHGVLQGERQGDHICGSWFFCLRCRSRFLYRIGRCFGRGLCRRLRWKRCFCRWSPGWLRHSSLCRKHRCFRRSHFLYRFLCRWSLG